MSVIPVPDTVLTRVSDQVSLGPDLEMTVFLGTGRKCRKSVFLTRVFVKKCHFVASLDTNFTHFVRNVSILRKFTVFYGNSLFWHDFSETLLLTRVKSAFPLSLKWKKPVNPGKDQ